MRKLAVLALLGLCSCAYNAKFARIDGSPAVPSQFETDRTICDGELGKAELANTGGISVRAQINAQHSVFEGCMAQRGWQVVSR